MPELIGTKPENAQNLRVELFRLSAGAMSDLEVESAPPAVVLSDESRNTESAAVVAEKFRVCSLSI